MHILCDRNFLEHFKNISFRFSVFTTGGGGTSIQFCSGFLNLLYRRCPPIANTNKLRLPTYSLLFISGLGLCSIPSCFVICSFKSFSSSFLCGYIRPISFLVQFSEGSSVLLQFLVADSQFPLCDLSFNLVPEFFA